MNKKRFILFPALLFLLLSCNNKKETITPILKNITESVYASGIIKSKNQYEVFSKSNGILEKVFVKEGMHIKKDGMLFQIDSKNSRLATKNAQLAFTANDYKINTDRLHDIQNAIQLAVKKLTNDSLLLSRQQQLWSNNIGSQIEVEQRELNFENSKVVLDRAMISYEDLNRQLKFASGQSKINLQAAQSVEDDLMIRSELDGIVYKINKEQGELVTSLSPLAVIGADDFILELNIDEFDIVKIKPGQQVIVRMDSYKSQGFEAIISSIYPMMNERTRTFKAEAVFTKKPEILFPNLTLEANIVLNVKQNVLTIPRNYLIKDSMVMLENGTMQQIKTGLMDYNLVEILSGLPSDSKIILPEK
ncbi:MAG: efflux RND transporter periplasmic adaptor subunit [Saprospiraceae bacterium]